MTNKARLRRRWQEVNDALTELAYLHVWPAGQDIAEIERELLAELDEIEYVLGEDLWKRGLL